MKIEASNNSHSVNLSIEECKFMIEGSSFSETADKIYDQVTEWIEKELPAMECELNCIFKLYVISSVTQKKILYIFSKLDEFCKSGKKIKITWYISEDDEDNVEFAEELETLFEIPFEIIQE
ncbi:MAG: DUF1987 domain-containing protein [Bacteroidales bacterium]|nr:DUF1987 domain-containing protein [Bacteroidales bacterium]